VGSLDPSAPRMLGRYALYEKLASGGMASVHIGRLLGPVGFARTVAIKRMHPQFAADPEFVSMFLDEARLAARIRHPNVVPTLDVVAMTDELFLVMEFVQGESLARLIRAAGARGERIPPEMLTAMMVGALHGLHAAHEAKSDSGMPLDIVHRDVTPQNILVGIDGVARVLDFGVAKAAGRLQTTRDGQLKGKLGYMAPEQIRGEVSRRTDVYAASVVLWEALTGKRLFRGDNDAQVLSQILEGCRIRPSERAAGVPPALDEVTMRGLATDPAQRFPTARDMARALEEAIPLATASRIGDWVEQAAKQTLDERSARIASIESDSSLKAPPEVLAAAAAIDDAVSTQLSSGSVSSPGRPSPAGARRRAGWLVAAGAMLLVGVSVVALTVARRSQPAPAAAMAAAAPPPAAVADPSPPTSSSQIAESSPPPAPSAPSSDVSAPASSVRPPPAVGRTTPPVRVTSVAPTSPSPAAKPTYNPLEHL
jgi:serine/threonine protein kinase